MFVLPGISRSSLMSIFGMPANRSDPLRLNRAPLFTPMRSVSYTGSLSAKRPAVALSPLRTALRPIPPGPPTKPPTSKSAILLPNSNRAPHFGSRPPAPVNVHSSPRRPVQKDVNAYKPLGCFRYRPAEVDIVSGSFGSLEQGSISALLNQAAIYREQIAKGINLLQRNPRMAPIHRVLLLSGHLDRAWRVLTAAMDVKVMIKEGIAQEMSELEGHPTKLLLHRHHWCINNNLVSTTATDLYGPHLRHAENQFVMLDKLRERLLTDLISITRSGKKSFPAIDLAIKAFTLLPDGSFNMPAFKHLKTALNIKEVNQIPNFAGRNHYAT